MALFTDVVPSSVLVYDPATGLITVNGSTLVDTAVAGIGNLPSAVTYDGNSVVVKNPAGNTSNYFPVDMYAMNSRWFIKGGKSLLHVNYPKRRHCFPAVVWNNGGLTLASAAAGAQTKLTGTLGHALTTANQITAGDTYVYVSGSTGAGTVDWTVGWYKVTAITDAGNDFTVLRAYDANLKEPVISETGTETEGYRFLLPPLSITGGFEIFVLTKNSTNATEHKTRVRYGANGAAIGSMTEIMGSNDTNLQVVSFRAGMQNAGSNTVQVGMGGTSDVDGWGVGGTSYAAPTIDNSSAVTDIAVTMSVASNDSTIEIVAYRCDWWY